MESSVDNGYLLCPPCQRGKELATTGWYYQPPYSPDFNPAEEAFSYVKGYLRKHDDLLQAGAPLQYILQAAFESITDKHCESWINDCGYV